MICPKCCPEVELLFRFRGSVLPKACLWAAPTACVAVMLHYLFAWTGTRFDIGQGNQIWSSFNFVLGVLIVFRTNQAYSRFWEGATLLQQVRGEWFNATSSLMAFCSRDDNMKSQVEAFQHQIVRLMSMLYCAGLQQVTLLPDEKMEIIDNDGFDPASLEFLNRGGDRCEIILQWVQRLIVEGSESGVVPIPAPILSRVFQELSRGIVNIHNVRKIAEIPFPFPYTQMVILLLLLQTMLTPLLASMTSQNAWWGGAMTFITLISLWSLNYIAAEIEHPFGEDINDLPVADMLKDLNMSLRTLLVPQCQIPPSFKLSLGNTCTSITCAQAKFLTTNRDQVHGFAKARRPTLRTLQRSESISLSGTSGQPGMSMSSTPCPKRKSYASASKDFETWVEARISAPSMPPPIDGIVSHARPSELHCIGDFVDSDGGHKSDDGGLGVTAVEAKETPIIISKSPLVLASVVGLPPIANLDRSQA